MSRAVTASPWRISRVPPWSYSLLLQWFGLGPKVWPIPAIMESDWRRVIFTFWRERVAFEPAEVRRWFRKRGWSAGQTREILGQIRRDLKILDHYAEMIEALRGGAS